MNDYVQMLIGASIVAIGFATLYGVGYLLQAVS